MEQRGTIRRSRRLRERGRREKNEGRKSVGDDLGVTPVRGKAVNLAEARAMQDARAAAGDPEEGPLAKDAPHRRARAVRVTSSPELGSP